MPSPLPTTPRSALPAMPARIGRAGRRLLAGLALLCTALTGTQAAATGLDERAAAWEAADARVLVRTAPRLVDGALAPTFHAMDRRVGAYADWVYGWLSSLLTAWDLGATAAAEAQREITAGRLPGSAALYDRLADVVQQRFEETVLLPERTDQAIAQAWTRAMVRVAALDSALAVERRAKIKRAAARRRLDPGSALRRFGAPLLAASVTASGPPPDLALQALSDVEDNAGGTTDGVLVRSLRPLAARALSVTTRVLLAPVAGGLLASPIAGTNGIAAAVGTLAVVSAGIWGADYAINRADSMLSRPAFEAELRRLVREAHAQASRTARRHARGTVCSALAAAAACGATSSVAAAGGDG